jgi:hypothetical protein
MKKILVILLISLMLTGCFDSNKNNNVVIGTDGGWYINTSESVGVNSYNGYRLIGSNKVNNPDGSITVVLKFNKPIQ